MKINKPELLICGSGTGAAFLDGFPWTSSRTNSFKAGDTNLSLPYPYTPGKQFVSSSATEFIAFCLSLPEFKTKDFYIVNEGAQFVLHPSPAFLFVFNLDNLPLVTPHSILQKHRDGKS